VPRMSEVSPRPASLLLTPRERAAGSPQGLLGAYCTWPDKAGEGRRAEALLELMGKVRTPGQDGWGGKGMQSAQEEAEPSSLLRGLDTAVVWPQIPGMQWPLTWGRTQTLLGFFPAPWGQHSGPHCCPRGDKMCLAPRPGLSLALSLKVYAASSALGEQGARSHNPGMRLGVTHPIGV
jgi:hypothetical protein